LIHAADEAMYEAKQAGRDRVVVAQIKPTELQEDI
jgi:PleD family two-component response regulator